MTAVLIFQQQIRDSTLAGVFPCHSKFLIFVSAQMNSTCMYSRTVFNHVAKTFSKDITPFLQLLLGDIQGRNEPNHLVNARSENQQPFLDTLLGHFRGHALARKFDTNHEPATTDVNDVGAHGRVAFQFIQESKEFRRTGANV